MIKTFLAAFALFLSAGSGFAQTTLATLTGSVIDATGAAVVGAKVQGAQTDTQYTYETQTNESGVYTLANLREGTYEVKVIAPGFREARTHNLTLVAREIRRLDVKLEVGEVTTSVEVQAGAAVIETETARISQSRDARELKDLPLNTRSVTAFLALVPRRRTGNHCYGHLSLYRQPPQPVRIHHRQRLRRLRHAVLSRPGPVRPRAPRRHQPSSRLLARRPGLPSPRLQRPQPDLLLLLLRDFARQHRAEQYQPHCSARRVARGRSLQPVTRHDHQRPDERSGLPRQRHPGDPAQSGRAQDPEPLLSVAQLRQQFDSAIAQLSPEPHAPVRSQQLLTTRIDHRFTSNFFVYGRYTWQRQHSTDYESKLPTVGRLTDTRDTRNAVVSVTNMIKPTLVNELRYGYMLSNEPRWGAQKGLDLVKQLGLTGLVSNLPDLPGIPNITWSGLGLQSITQTAWRVPGFYNRNNVVQENLSWMRGRHTVRGGMMWGYYNANDDQASNGLYGNLQFSNKYTGFAYSDFLLGMPTTMQRAAPPIAQPSHHPVYDFFITDEFKVNPRCRVAALCRQDRDPRRLRRLL